MTTKVAMKSTNVNRRREPLTPEQAKQRLYAKGVTLTQFAERHGFKYRTVSEVVRGVNKGLYGEGHRVAVALGIKATA
jgi:gp16 family phage-associated protein